MNLSLSLSSWGKKVLGIYFVFRIFWNGTDFWCVLQQLCLLICIGGWVTRKGMREQIVSRPHFYQTLTKLIRKLRCKYRKEIWEYHIFFNLDKTIIIFTIFEWRVGLWWWHMTNMSKVYLPIWLGKVLCRPQTSDPQHQYCNLFAEVHVLPYDVNELIFSYFFHLMRQWSKDPHWHNHFLTILIYHSREILTI